MINSTELEKHPLIDKEVTLKPISKHGKDRVSQFGDKWIITDVSDTILFTHERGPWLRLETSCGKGDIRWAKLKNDRNFEVIV